MKSKIEFKYDIRKQNVKYPNYLENIKVKSKQVYFTKINSGTNPLERNIQTISLRINPQIEFEQKSTKFKN